MTVTTRRAAGLALAGARGGGPGRGDGAGARLRAGDGRHAVRPGAGRLALVAADGQRLGLQPARRSETATTARSRTIADAGSGCRSRLPAPNTCPRPCGAPYNQLETQFEVRIEILSTTEPMVDNYLLEVVRADGTTVSLSPSQAGESDAGTARQGERSRRSGRSRGAVREDEDRRRTPDTGEAGPVSRCRRGR